MFQNAAIILEKNLYGILSTTGNPLSVGFKWNMGTGFAINDRDILTAAHNLHVDKNPNVIHSRIEVILNNQLGNTMQQATLIHLDNQNDLAILRISQTPGGVTFRTAPAQVGESCAFMGYPAAFHNNKLAVFNTFFKAGVITKIEPNHIFVDRTLFPGSSGGPISDINGNIMGIVNQYVLINNNQLPLEVSFGKDTNTIIIFLSNLNINFNSI